MTEQDKFWEQPSTLADDNFKLFGPDPNAPPIYVKDQSAPGQRPLNLIYRLEALSLETNTWLDLGTAWAHKADQLVTAAHVALYVEHGQMIRLTPSDPTQDIVTAEVSNDFRIRFHDHWDPAQQTNAADIAVINFRSNLFPVSGDILAGSHAQWDSIRQRTLFVVGGLKDAGRAIIGRGKYFRSRGYDDVVFYTVNTIEGMSGGPVFVTTRDGLDVVSALHLGDQRLPDGSRVKNYANRLSNWTLSGVGLVSLN